MIDCVKWAFANPGVKSKNMCFLGMDSYAKMHRKNIERGEDVTQLETNSFDINEGRLGLKQHSNQDKLPVKKRKVLLNKQEKESDKKALGLHIKGRGLDPSPARKLNPYHRTITALKSKMKAPHSS